MKENRLEYKCRRCGLIDQMNNLGLSSKMSDAEVCERILNSAYMSRSYHECKDDGRGISDFIGLSPGLAKN